MVIHETPEKLIQDWWLIKFDTKDEYRFNLHKLYPEKYPEAYKDWKLLQDKFWKVTPIKTNNFDELRDKKWFRENVWCKWDFILEYSGVCTEWNFICWFQTPRTTPKELLKRFAELSKINFTCEYDEPWFELQWTISSVDWHFDISEEEYQQHCESCWEKSSDTIYRDRHDNYECNECYKESCSNN